MRLADFIDEHILGGSVTVITEEGDLIVQVMDASDEEVAKAYPYLNREVIKSGESDGGVYAYVAGSASMPGNRSQEPGVYKGHIEDEAAWSLDWRSREKHASEKQLKLLRKHISIYRQIKKPRWPDDPAGLLTYEASDALDVIFEILRGSK